MKIQSINEYYAAPNFGSLKVLPGTFESLKTMKNFPKESNENYKQLLLDFYKNLNEYKKKAKDNTDYNVVLKPLGIMNGKVVIEDSEGIEQTGFKTTFEKLFDINELKPQKLLTPKEKPGLIRRYLANREIKERNKKLLTTPTDYKFVFDKVVKRIAAFIDYADELKERKLLHNRER